MGETTAIPWCKSTFSPWEGCSSRSEGCRFCYARDRAKRFGKDFAVRRRMSDAYWRGPLAWNRAQARAVASHAAAGTQAPPWLVFCASLCDYLDDEVPVEWLADLLGLIAATPHLTWLCLTKRPENWRGRLTAVLDVGTTSDGDIRVASAWLLGTPPANVWIGTTVEDQRRADERISHLLSIPARVRFLSCEPLLEPVNLRAPIRGPDGDLVVDALTGEDQWGERAWEDGRRIDWAVVGGESGPHARPFDLAWARSLRDQCAAANVSFFMKQMGAHPVEDGQRLYLADRTHGADPAEWPEDLRIRQFPEVDR